METDKSQFLIFVVAVDPLFSTSTSGLGGAMLFGVSVWQVLQAGWGAKREQNRPQKSTQIEAWIQRLLSGWFYVKRK